MSDAERLAKAGVKMDLGRIEVLPDQDVPSILNTTISPYPDAAQLALPILQRYRQSLRAKGHNEGSMAPQMFASVHRDIVYVFVVPVDHPPQIITDDAHIYPSDALLANIHLLLKYGRANHGGDRDPF